MSNPRIPQHADSGKDSPRGGAYARITASDHLASLRWDVPAPNKGQIVEVAYAEPGPHAHEAGPGATYKRITDASDRSVAYYRLVQS